MALCQPTVHGPLSTLSRQVRVTEQLVGAILRVLARGAQDREIARVTAASSEERVALSAGTVLNAGELLVAIQEWNGELSDEPGGDLAPRVQPAPSSLPAVSFNSHVYHCGRCVRIGGTVPGADVNIECAGVTLGHGVAEEMHASVTLDIAIPGELAISAHQVAANMPPGPSAVVTADSLPIPQGQRIPPPNVAPVGGCDSSILVSGALAGAVVTIERDGGGQLTAGFDTEKYHVIVNPHMDPRESFRIKQDVARECERPGEWSEWIPVGEIEPVDPPYVVGPLCAGGGTVTISGLRRGAIIQIAVGVMTPVSTDIDPTGLVFEAQRTFTGQAPPGAIEWTFRVSPLEVGWLSLTQEVCGVVSAWSRPIPIYAHPGAIETVQILGPLHECAQAVSLSHVHPGASVQILARHEGQEVALSDPIRVLGLEASVSVTPHLREGDRIFVRQWACSVNSAIHGDELVLPAPQLEPPTIVGSILQGDDFLEVKGFPGARVEAWINRPSIGRLFAGSTVADGLGAAQVMPTVLPLLAGDQVSVKQRLCPQSEFSAESHPEVVQKFSARPFYLLGHNPNDITEVGKCIAQGANALEPDINLLLRSGPAKLCVSHYWGRKDNLVRYLQALRQKVFDDPSIGLIYFDCKPAASIYAGHGVTLLQAIREHLTFDWPLNIIISVANLNDSEEVEMFRTIRWGLRSREILMVDEENDVRMVGRYFANAGVSHCGYGNGISILNRVIGPNVRTSIETACAARAASGQFKFVNAWTINKDGDLRLFIRAGVDGMISDDLDSFDDIVGEPLMQALVRKATIKDNPFIRPPHAYGLAVYTADRSHAGTDANVTFTLKGAAGTASVTVDTEKINRMERGEWNHVTLSSDDLGPLQDITVRRDNQGNAPDWRLGSIQVRSARYKVAMQAIFDQWIDSTAPFTRQLVNI
jgi:PLAT/LH2 domain